MQWPRFFGTLCGAPRYFPHGYDNGERTVASNSLTTEMHDAMDKQLRELRSQIANINKSLSDHGLDIEDLRDEADNLIHGATKNAQRAAQHVQDEAVVVAKAARKAPMAATTALGLAGLIGFGIGYLVSQSHYEQRHRWFG